MKVLLLILFLTGCVSQPFVPSNTKTYTCDVTDYEQAVSIRCLKAKKES